MRAALVACFGAQPRLRSLSQASCLGLWRRGNAKDTRGTAYVVYEDIYDAKTAVDHLSGFNVANRYLIVLYFSQARMGKKIDQKTQKEALAKLQKQHGVSGKEDN